MTTGCLGPCWSGSQGPGSQFAIPSVPVPSYAPRYTANMAAWHGLQVCSKMGLLGRLDTRHQILSILYNCHGALGVKAGTCIRGLVRSTLGAYGVPYLST